MTKSTTLLVASEVLLRAARALSAATRYDEALALLPPAESVRDSDVRAEVTMAMAEIVGRRDYTHARRSSGAPLPLDEVAGVSDRTGWDVAMHRLRTSYADQLRREDGSLWFGPEGRDPAVRAELRREAERLRDTAPDGVCRGWAEMCLGWISDNIDGDRDAAPSHYERGLAAGREADDALLVFEAQRHLGDHDHDRGDHDAARERWQESTAEAARAGHVAGVLAQQILLAVLARDEGDESAARLLAAEVRRWAEAIGAVQIARQSADFLAGVDPTKLPEEAQTAAS
jgi:tetratricopeptide (TPR) repeat protein